jgi:putative heme transporter
VLIGGLVAAGGARPQVVAAVLVYRALTWLLPIPVGIGTYLWWRRSFVAPGTQAQNPVRLETT